MDFMSIRRESERLVIRPMKEADFEIILEGLKGQGQRQNKYDGSKVY